MSEEAKAEQPAAGAVATPNARDANNKKGGQRNHQQRSNKAKWKDNAVPHVPKEKFTGRSDDLHGFIYDVSNSRGGVAYIRELRRRSQDTSEKNTRQSVPMLGPPYSPSTYHHPQDPLLQQQQDNPPSLTLWNKRYSGRRSECM
jgi:hypothetical protein